METRILKVNFNKSGRGTLTPRITLPVVVVRKIGVTEEDREVELIFDEEKEQIILKKFKKSIDNTSRGWYNIIKLRVIT